MKIIALNGVAGSGKDTVGGIISAWAYTMGYTTRQDAFAHRLKISAAHSLGVFSNEIEFCNRLKNHSRIEVYTEIDRNTVKKDEISGREYLQYYGTEAHRDVFGADFWVDQVLSQPEDKDFLIITDCRFPNEAEAVKEKGGQVWRILRDDAPGAGNHSSEQTLDSKLVDLEIQNNHSLDSLRAGVMSILDFRFTRPEVSA